MKKFFKFGVVAVTAMILQGCFFGSGGSTAPPPNNVVATAKDSRVVLTWDMVPGVQYWIWESTVPGVTPQNCSSNASCYTATNATSPASVSSYISGTSTPLVNGTTYYYSINGRTGGGPGGTGSMAVSATPRLSGATWTTGTAATTSSLRGVTYGTTAYGTIFVAVGDGGALYSSSDIGSSLSNGNNWVAAASNPAAGINFRGATFDAGLVKYMAAGSGGVILQSLDGTNWTLTTSSTYITQPLYSIANNGGNTIVATGAAGTILTSTDGGATWPTQTISGAPALNGVTYGYVTALVGYRFVAVGAGGTLLYSSDGSTWAAATPPSPISTSSVFNSVTYGLVAGVGTFAAVTADGYVTTSTDGVSWTSPVQVSTTLNSVTASMNAYTSSFVAVDNLGNIFRSIDGGLTWPQVYTGTGALFAVAHGSLLDYSAVGVSGLNLYSD
jgi:photosystem II stability/assembly factor-like uncharacterized protein